MTDEVTPGNRSGAWFSPCPYFIPGRSMHVESYLKHSWLIFGLKKVIDIFFFLCKNIANLREQTVDAEIKRKGHFQRVRKGESRAERCFANGPQRAWGKRRAQVFHDVGHTLVAGNMLVFRESVETQSKVAPRVMRFHPALDRSVTGLSSAGFLMYKSSRKAGPGAC